jgi:hypothetical protein
MAPRSTKSNLRNLDTFNGSDPANLNLFLTQCYLHFAERTQDFPTDDDKILFMISYLLSGEPLFRTHDPVTSQPVIRSPSPPG